MGRPRADCGRGNRHRPADKEDVRSRLNALLDKARSAEKMPWSERDARMWQTVFPNTAKCLPHDEADQLRFEFAREMERLRQAAQPREWLVSTPTSAELD